MREKETEENRRQHRLLRITNYAFSLFFFGIGVMMDGTVFAEHYQVRGEYAPGTGFFPLVLGTLMMIASVAVAVQTAKGKYETKKVYPDRKKTINMMIFIGIVTGSLLLTDPLGLIPSLFLIFALIMLAIYRYAWWYSLLVSAISVGIIYLIFVVGFSIRFPVGIFGF